MFNFFKKKEPKKDITLNYSNIKVDMHSHVLPGIDDGAKNLEESISLVNAMMEAGIEKIIATPHIMADYYRNTSETINDALDLLKEELKRRGINITVEAAAKHYFDENFERMVDKRELMTMGDNYALFEYSFISPPPNAYTVIQKMIEWGEYRPILAHPERYAYMNMEAIADVRKWGCNVQLNTISLTGYYGKDIKKRAETMLDLQLVDFISSDMHHVRHAEAFNNALAFPYVEMILKDYPLKNILLA